MRSLEDYERERAEAPDPEPHKTGIACPECAQELVDEGDQLFSRIPPMKRVSCLACGFSKVVLA
jgi:hypothetical protein